MAAGGSSLAPSASAPNCCPRARLERAARLHGRTGAEDLVLGGRPLRMYAAPIPDAGGPAAGGAVLVATDTADIGHTISRLGELVALAGAGIVLLAAAAAAALTRRGLRPLRSLADAAGEIERTADPARRLPEAQTLDEVGQLTGVLNRMLASLEQARAGERRFLADASHELRTPVTALLGNVEYAAAPRRRRRGARRPASRRHPAGAARRLAVGAGTGGGDGGGERAGRAVGPGAQRARSPRPRPGPCRQPR